MKKFGKESQLLGMKPPDCIREGGNKGESDQARSSSFLLLPCPLSVSFTLMS